MERKIVLASGSPRRREYLAQLGLPVSVVINALYRQIILKKGIPFSMTLSAGMPVLEEMSEAEFALRADRYCAEMKKTGSSSLRIGKDMETRKHACLIPWEELDHLSERENANCPRRIDSWTVMDSTLYDARHNVVHYYYTLSGRLDDVMYMKENSAFFFFLCI